MGAELTDLQRRILVAARAGARKNTDLKRLAKTASDRDTAIVALKALGLLAEAGKDRKAVARRRARRSGLVAR